MHNSNKKHPAGLRLIAGLKLVSCLLLAAAALTAFHVINVGIDRSVLHWVLTFNLNPNGNYIRKLIQWLSNEGHLNRIGIAASVYSLLYLIEGIGLYREKRWAEYFTLFITVSLIPFEVYEVAQKVDFIRVGALTVNALIVIYLVLMLYRGRHRK